MILYISMILKNNKSFQGSMIPLKKHRKLIFAAQLLLNWYEIKLNSLSITLIWALNNNKRLIKLFKRILGISDPKLTNKSSRSSRISMKFMIKSKILEFIIRLRMS